MSARIRVVGPDHPDHPIEQRARELDAGFLRRIREMPLHMLQTERAAHQRMYHFGEECPDTCWRGAALNRQVTKRLLGR